MVLRTVPAVGELPTFAHEGDAGADLRAAEGLTLAPGERALVATGTRVALPAATVGLVCPRSGLASRHGITIVNAPGVVDSGYRGEIKVCLLNTDPESDYTIEPGDRIAQLVVIAVAPVTFTRVDELPDSSRGERGFGSSGYGGE